MRRLTLTLAAGGLIAAGALALAASAVAHSDASKPAHHEDGAAGASGEDDHHAGGGHGEEGHHDMERMREMHRQHDHKHDFAAMDRLSPERRERLLSLMRDIGLALPPMDPERGRTLFLDKGCVACHEVNGVGGTLGPSLDAEDMPEPMNTFEFAARMWRGAPAMIDLQSELLGDVITLDGQDLADIIAFAHDEEAQSKLSAEQVPEEFREVIEGE